MKKGIKFLVVSLLTVLLVGCSSKEEKVVKTCTLNSEVKQGLHFEMYKNGAVINPEKFYDKSVKDLTNN